tara:strand:- start:4515 stop:5318 length:804 start_codon:yes stop_codon:yes gene_type:complete
VVIVSSSRRRSGPVVALITGIPNPSVKGIIERHSRVKLCEIIAVHARKTKGCRHQPGRFRRQIMAVCVGTADDGGEMFHGLGFKGEFPDHGVKGTLIAAMAPEDIFNIEGRGVELFGHSLDFRRLDKQELGVAINKAADQPGAGNAVDFRPMTGNPDGSSFRVVYGKGGRRDHGQFRIAPAEDAALKALGGNAAIAENSCRTLAEFPAFLAYNDDALARELWRESGDILIRMTEGRRQQAWIIGKVFINADIDKNRRIGQADQAGKL